MIFWVIFFVLLVFFVLLNENFSKTRANLKILFTVLKSAHLNASKLVEKHKKTFSVLTSVIDVYSSFWHVRINLFIVTISSDSIITLQWVGLSPIC